MSSVMTMHAISCIQLDEHIACQHCKTEDSLYTAIPVLALATSVSPLVSVELR